MIRAGGESPHGTSSSVGEHAAAGPAWSRCRQPPAATSASTSPRRRLDRVEHRVLGRRSAAARASRIRGPPRRDRRPRAGPVRLPASSRHTDRIGWTTSTDRHAESAEQRGDGLDEQRHVVGDDLHGRAEPGRRIRTAVHRNHRRRRASARSRARGARRRMSSERPFGDAVAAHRSTCAEVGGSRTTDVPATSLAVESRPCSRQKVSSLRGSHPCRVLPTVPSLTETNRGDP